MVSANMMLKLVMVISIVMKLMVIDAVDTNDVYDPCSDTKVSKLNGFTFIITQLSPCDTRLNLASTAQLAVFRPKVDEISLLTINGSSYSPVSYKWSTVARTPPALITDKSHVITSFTLGTLQNLFWKRSECVSCSGKKSFVCLNQQDCKVYVSKCTGFVDCSLGIQLAFSGTDKYNEVLNSWYEVKNLRQYSLFGLYSNLKDSIINQFDSLF
ncbi:hypothetical protein MKW94_025792 [Papaver nudicaule]|uniref:Uncharacterized protein n=1 Tax=Papaver nudicaule TaxID=74823 RepID=A0AA41S885_PAPNU|nr:hypothetical protein [Papaver nudicaule]